MPRSKSQATGLLSGLRIAATAVLSLATACDVFGPSSGRDLRLSSVDLGYFHACGIEFGSGDVYCWGQAPGGLDPGNLPHPDSLFPFGTVARRVPTTAPAVHLSANDNARCIIDVRNEALCKGLNTYGVVGVGNNVAHRGFAEISAEGPWSDISAGGTHTCALSRAGVAYCWGEQTGGKLGDGVYTFTFRPTPEPVQTTLRFREISAGNFHSCALTEAGEAWCWGQHGGRYLGTGGPLPPEDASAYPVAVAGGLAFESVSVGEGSTCALTAGGRVFCWGRNLHGELGFGEIVTAEQPRPVLSEVRFRSVSTGGLHACALTTKSALYCWGYNAQGQLGTGDTDSRSRPTLIAPPGRYRSVSAGARSTCALRWDFVAECWGYGEFGQLGNGGRRSSTGPVRVVRE